MSEIDTFVAFAEDLANRTGELVRNAWQGAEALSYKADGSALTQTDLRVEAAWRALISERFPDHGILGEEEGAQQGASAYTWVLDPVDGTRQFGMGLLNHACLIALCRDDRPILGLIDMPLARKRAIGVAGRGTRFAGRPVRVSDAQELATARLMLGNPDSFPEDHRARAEALHGAVRITSFDGGSPAYAALARGALDLCLNGPDLDAFDICALVPVVEGAGGVITDWQGERLGLSARGAILASASPALHAQALAKLNG